MADDNDTLKEHEPTQKKLDDARQKGEIPRSTDLTVATGYLGFLIATVLFGASAMQTAGSNLMLPLDQANRLSEVVVNGQGASITAGITANVVLALLPWLVLPGLMSLCALILQRGIVFAPTKLAPKLNRVSLISNAKNKFGRSGLFEFLKSFTKLGIYSAVLGIFLSSELETIVATIKLEPAQAMFILARMLVQFLLLIFIVAIVLAGIDLLWQNAEHRRKNKMSHNEVKEELKQSEGDPTMKAARRQKGFDLATNRMLADVPDAEVVIVNPTHYAVALKWDRSTKTAPECVAKGVDEIAARIREIALENGVPIQRDPPTARALHSTVEIGEQIKPEHYKAVAAAVRFADGIRSRMTRK